MELKSSSRETPVTARHVIIAKHGCTAGTQPPGSRRPAGLGQAHHVSPQPGTAVTAAPLTRRALKMSLWPPRVAPVLCPGAPAPGRDCPWPWSPWLSSPQMAVLSMPAAKAGPSSQHAGQGAPAPSQRVMATAELPALSHWCPQGWPAGLWEQGVRQASLPRLRAAAPLLACPALHLQGTDLDSAGSGNRTQWDAAPQARAEPLAPDTTRPLPSCSGGLYEGAGTAPQGAVSPPSPPPPRQPRAPAGAFLSWDRNPGGPQHPPWVPC